jgi:SAM-dependent methyltransferase
VALPEACPLCGADRQKQSIVTPHVSGQVGKHGNGFFYCESCQVRYQYPGLTPQEEEQFYSAEFESFMSVRSGSDGGWLKAEDHVAANEATRERRMKYLAPNLDKKLDILEIGCSSGFMLFPLVAAGHVCKGVEPSGVFREFVRSRGIEVFDSIEHLSTSKELARYDLIMHFFVLEHISDPIHFLNRQLEILKPGGKLIFEIPNAADPLASLYDIPAFERFYWSKAHPWYFNENSLHYLMGKLDVEYELIREQRYDLSNHIIWARDGKPGGMSRFSSALGPELDAAYKKALINSGHCDTLIGIIKK